MNLTTVSDDNYRKISSWTRVLEKIIENITPDIAIKCASFCFTTVEFNIRRMQSDREKLLVPKFAKILEKIKPIMSGDVLVVNTILKSDFEQLDAWANILDEVTENLDFDYDNIINCKIFCTTIIMAGYARMSGDHEKTFAEKFSKIIKKFDSVRLEEVFTRQFTEIVEKTNSKQIIPRKIHYCWLSGDKIPVETIKCINTWKKVMPEYEFVLWDNDKFDVNSVVFTKEACDVKKWAFASDYIRLYALYTEGGVYFDTDVIIKKSFDNFLCNSLFTSLEYSKTDTTMANALEFLNEDGTLKNSKDRILNIGIGIQAAVLGCIKGHPFLKSCLDWYQAKNFILPDGTYYNNIIAPEIYADIMIEYGFRYKDDLQKLRDDIVVYPSYVFAGNIWEANKESYAIHCCHGSWR